MPVTVDASSNFLNPNMDFNGHLFSHAPGGNPNRVMLVLLTFAETTPGTQGVPLNSVDFDGVQLTLWNTLIANGARRQVWYLINPHASSGVVTVLPTSDYDGVVIVIGCAVTLSGTDQVMPLGSWTTATGTSTAPSVTVSSTSTDSLILDVLGIVQGANFATRTVGSGQTVISNQQATGTFGSTVRLSNSDSWEPGTGAGVVMSWTLSLSKNWGIAGFEVLPITTPAPLITLTAGLEMGPATAAAGVDLAGSAALELGPAQVTAQLGTQLAVSVTMGPEAADTLVSTQAAAGLALGPESATAVLGLQAALGLDLGPAAAAVGVDLKADLVAGVTSEPGEGRA